MVEIPISVFLSGIGALALAVGTLFKIIYARAEKDRTELVETRAALAKSEKDRLDFVVAKLDETEKGAAAQRAAFHAMADATKAQAQGALPTAREPMRSLPE